MENCLFVEKSIGFFVLSIIQFISRLINEHENALADMTLFLLTVNIDWNKLFPLSLLKAYSNRRFE